MNNKIINIKSLSISFNNNKVIDDMDFQLYENEIVSIIGETGSGKTTLAKYIMGLNMEVTKITVKEYWLNYLRIDLNQTMISQLYGNTISMVFQDPVTSLNPTLKIGKQLKIVLKEKYENMSNNEVEKRIECIFKEINIDNYKEVINKYPAEISGGMNQRINIALSLIKEPKILIMDEPTSAIDLDNRLNLIELIKKIKQNRKLSVIFITHDILLAKKIADRIIVIKKGKIIEGCKKENNKFNFNSQYAKKLYKNASLDTKNIYPKNDIAIIEFNNVMKSFNKQQVIDNISFNVYKNDTLGIVGKSGSGKTTICKLIVGIYEQTKGIINIKNNIRIEMVYQNPNTSINPKKKIYKILNEENYINKRKEYNKEEIQQYLKDFNLPIDVLERKSFELSGGQNQIISIIRALLNKPDIIILDEPTSSLDVSSQKKVLDLLKMVKKKYFLTYIIVSHDEKVIDYMCNRCFKI